MAGYDIWKFLHIMMFVFWIGTDLGVFLSAKKSTDPKLSFDTRVTLLHIALRIELLPRTMWKAALPLGVMLMVGMELIDFGFFELTLTWLFSIAWWAISMYGAWHYDKPIGHQFAKLTNILTGGVGIGLVAIAALSLAGYGPIPADASWLSWKIGLYGLINLMVIVMIIVFDPLGAAFGRLAVEGSTPEIEGIISGVMDRSTWIIWATYTIIALVAFIATTKVI
ncbi:MAG TPA: hypothetical protein QF499_06125 [Gammaproteobacteria bacterium]|jgi:hypothetical protein|nr:hypothetical protein [Chromatiales bacterium]MDP7153944.1 hypothetical protein [Gammaproteobacteria bacterium]MDP7297104.1 hypothetical protein [Gammaproteobacteria bacterium]MDP7661431.1 hypothetical protein [Gammaproteobacteria bacterium]HJP38694.1 hypothetical protein [Gammaproteobacteria bacterium]